MDQQVVEDYLKNIYKLTRHGERASTTALSAALGLPVATVSKTLPRLASMQLVAHDPYRGADLTEAGRAVAIEVVRHHRLVELFLARTLGMSWDEVHHEAERLEHVLSDAMEQRMDALLGFPTLDPHGDPIPSPTLDLTEARLPSLADAREGDSLVVRRVSDNDAGVLRHLQSVGLVPGAEALVLSTSPMEGLMRFECGGEQKTLALKIAEAVFVEPAQDKESKT